MTPAAPRLTVWLALAAVAVVATVPARAQDQARVRASPEAAPCVRKALAAARSSGSVVVAEWPEITDVKGAQVLVASESEMTRLLEGGQAVLGSDAQIGTIAWSLNGAAAADSEVAVLSGPASRGVQRALARSAGPRVRVVGSAAEIDAAPLSVVPASWLRGDAPLRAVAGAPPLVIRAALATPAEKDAAAAALLRALQTEAAGQAFGACGRTSTP